MRLLLFGSALAVFWSAVTRPVVPTDVETTLIVGGDVLGYLAPCGCTKPMVGGILRWAKAARSLQAQGPTVVVVNGGFAKGRGRQDELKLEALAESYRMLSVNAVNLTLHEAALGKGALASLQNLTDNAVTSLSLESPDPLEARATIESGPFLIGGAVQNERALGGHLAEATRDASTAVAELVDEASSRGLAAVLLWSGDERSARDLAEAHPTIAAIVFSSDSVLRAPIVVGKTWLLTPGEKGRALVSARWNGQSFGDYGNVPLGPEIPDDTDVDRAYGRYLDRVADEHLLMAAPRTSEEEFAGNEACAKCHEAETKVWKDSRHSEALATLEKVRHDKDPDCVGCHVVGLESVKGFRSREETPELANVGCESCHGAGKAHAMAPAKSRMPKVGEASCMKCHVTDHSPNFDFAKYWDKIRH